MAPILVEKKYIFLVYCWYKIAHRIGNIVCKKDGLGKSLKKKAHRAQEKKHMHDTNTQQKETREQGLKQEHTTQKQDTIYQHHNIVLENGTAVGRDGWNIVENDNHFPGQGRFSELGSSVLLPECKCKLQQPIVQVF